MRIICVTTWFPTETKPGLGAFTVRDLQAIAAQGHEVRVVHLVSPGVDDGSRELHHAGFPVRRIPMQPTNPLSILRAGRQLRRYLRGADVVHTMAISSLLPFVFTRPRLPWVHTEHWSGLTTPGTLPKWWQALLPAVRQVLRLPQVVTAVCEFLAAPIREIRGARSTAVVPCIVEPLAQVAPTPPPDGVLDLVSVGGLIERKDPLLAVATCAELNRRGLPTRLTWVGDGPLRQATAELAAALGVEVRLLGSVDLAGVHAALAQADLFFGPTRADNFFVSAAEALVAGRMVVVGATGGQGEYIDPDFGILVAEQDAAAYADALQTMAARLEHTDAAAVAASIGQRFSAATVGAAYSRLYSDLTGN
ncbi:glycosyltransferase [Buchananella hordeovulneris]|uniref:Glycosyltransferase subfamily 4-like N-terminal domain-containing protein n=1 Tax=Buchananella hordeovulneris TaxID=52770 RepID=A0A1Q5PTT8_9ACTO|nr:glycosyltransferase [Buchananella hordeovulneris]MDO5079966.1 glycosyltransferase [Buchananella hordeovulneris]OKL50889.1 hypothetical protein BSZ40_10180 [Buchananella hordeovulneris]